MQKESVMMLCILIVAGLAGCFVTWLYLRFALNKKILDIPNNRSSHSTPTPSGGGVGFVLTLAVGMMVLLITGLVESGYLLLYAPLLSLALVGYLDDRHQLPIFWRLLAQILVVLIVLASLDPGTFLIGAPLMLVLLVTLVAGFYMLWLINLFNFMDGIDGIASVQFITVLGGALVLIMLKIPEQDYRDISLHIILLGAVAGFMLWNWEPAKIFMGDTGSLLLGAWIALASLETAQREWISIYSWLILMGVFITDASYTLLSRLLAGEKFYQAHRSHAYQRASRVYGHRLVVVSIIAINALWLFPVACLLEYCKGWELPLTFLAYLPLLLIQIVIRKAM